jgi:hypothetical protein
MKPKEILCLWVDAFNNADTETIANLYDCITKGLLGQTIFLKTAQSTN